MCIVIKSRPEFKMGHVGSKTRSLGQFLEKPCVLSRRHSFDPVFMKLCQNDFLTLNKHLSRRAMLSDDNSCSTGNVHSDPGLPWSGKNIWKMNFFPGQGKVREFCGQSGKFRKDLESQGEVRDFENRWLWQAVFRKFIYSVQEGKRCTFS